MSPVPDLSAILGGALLLGIVAGYGSLAVGGVASSVAEDAGSSYALDSRDDRCGFENRGHYVEVGRFHGTDADVAVLRENEKSQGALAGDMQYLAQSAVWGPQTHLLYGEELVRPGDMVVSPKWGHMKVDTCYGNIAPRQPVTGSS